MVPLSLVTVIPNPTLSSVNDYTDLPHFAAWLLVLLHPSAALPSPAPLVALAGALSLFTPHSVHCSMQFHTSRPPFPCCVSGIAHPPPSCADTSGAIKRKDWTDMREGKLGERRRAANVEQPREEEQQQKKKRNVKIQLVHFLHPTAHRHPWLSRLSFFFSLSVPSFIQYLFRGINMT